MLTTLQVAAIANGTAEIENFIVVKPAAETQSKADAS